MAQKGISLRAWTIYRADFIDDGGNDTGFRDAIVSELAQLEHMGERLGVGIVAAPIRERGPHGTWRTAAWVFQPETVPAAGTWSPAEVDLSEDEPPAAAAPGDPLAAAELPE